MPSQGTGRGQRQVPRGCAGWGWTCSSRCSCPGTIPFCPHPHFALFLFQIQEGEGRIWRVFLQFPICSSCCEAKEARCLWPSPLQLLQPALNLPSACLKPRGPRVLSHLLCHGSSVNHLEPSFTRQGSVELIAHQNIELVISAF